MGILQSLGNNGEKSEVSVPWEHTWRYGTETSNEISQHLVRCLRGKWVQRETPVAGPHTSLHGLLTVADHQRMDLF